MCEDDVAALVIDNGSVCAKQDLLGMMLLVLCFPLLLDVLVIKESWLEWARKTAMLEMRHKARGESSH